MRIGSVGHNPQILPPIVRAGGAREGRDKMPFEFPIRHGRSLVLHGTCVTCRGEVARVLEGAPVSEALQPGNKVI
jgi:hypothetical protein